MNNEYIDSYDLVKKIVEDSMLGISSQVAAIFILTVLIILFVIGFFLWIIKYRQIIITGKMENIKSVMEVSRELFEQLEDLNKEYDKLGSEIDKILDAGAKQINNVIEQIGYEFNEFLDYFSRIISANLIYMSYGMKNRHNILILEQRIIDILFLYRTFYELHEQRFSKNKLNIDFDYSKIIILYEFLNRRFYKKVYNYFNYKSLFLFKEKMKKLKKLKYN